MSGRSPRVWIGIRWSGAIVAGLGYSGKPASLSCQKQHRLGGCTA